MGLSRRLALLTAVIAVALVLGATEVALRWSERSRLDDRRRESVELATSWSEYLSRVAPQFVHDHAGDYGHLARVFEWSTSDEDEF